MEELLRQLQKAFHDFKELNDERLKKIEAKTPDMLLEVATDKANAAISEIEKKLRAEVEELEAKVNRFGTSGGPEAQNPARAEHRAAFHNFMRTGAENGLKDLQFKAALSSGSDADGGFVVPFELDQTISRVLSKMTNMRQLATVRPIGAANYKKIVNLGGNQSGWVGETDARPATNTPQFSELDFPAMTLYSNPATTQEVLDDSMLDLESWLADEISIDFSEREGLAFLLGNGVKQPRGILTYPTVANASYAWGKLGYIATGVSANFAASNPGDNLIDLFHSLRPGYRQNAALMMSTATLGAVRKFKTTYGEYLFMPALAAGMPSTVAGYPVYEDEYMPDIAANSFSIAFGDFKSGYVIVDRFGTRVLRDSYTNKPYIQFYTTKRVGGGVQKFEAIKLLKFGTS